MEDGRSQQFQTFTEAAPGDQRQLSVGRRVFCGRNLVTYEAAPRAKFPFVPYRTVDITECAGKTPDSLKPIAVH